MRLAIIAMLAIVLTACPAAVTDTCIAIKAADEACTMIMVPEPDGGVTSVKVSGGELRDLARAKIARDGGAK